MEQFNAWTSGQDLHGRGRSKTQEGKNHVYLKCYLIQESMMRSCRWHSSKYIEALARCADLTTCTSCWLCQIYAIEAFHLAEANVPKIKEFLLPKPIAFSCAMFGLTILINESISHPLESIGGNTLWSMQPGGFKLLYLISIYWNALLCTLYMSPVVSWNLCKPWRACLVPIPRDGSKFIIVGYLDVVLEAHKASDNYYVYRCLRPNSC